MILFNNFPIEHGSSLPAAFWVMALHLERTHGYKLLPACVTKCTLAKQPVSTETVLFNGIKKNHITTNFFKVINNF